MLPTRNGSVRLFRLFGIDVHLHWSWGIVAAIMIFIRGNEGYDSPLWPVLEYLALFAIVLMHEFGHALACRSVGGRADQIVLWPLGGVAYVAPPNRPGPFLWSIAAGPLVNLVLIPVTLIAYAVCKSVALPHDIVNFIIHLAVINAGLFVFNMLPIYPLDGGQILRSLLWFAVGAGRSLMISAWIGVVAAGLGIVTCMFYGETWLTIMAFFAAQRSWLSIQMARAIRQMETAPVNPWFRCPGCGKNPPAGLWWRCDCGAPMDPFATQATCTFCGKQHTSTACPNCHEAFPLYMWAATVQAASTAIPVPFPPAPHL